MDNPLASSFLIAQLLLPAWDSAVSTFKLLEIQPLCITDEKARPGKKIELAQGQNQAFCFLSGTLSPSHTFTAFSRPPYHSKFPHSEHSFFLNHVYPLLSWQLSSTKNAARGGQKSGTQETSTTQGNKCALNTHTHKNSVSASLPPGSFPWHCPRPGVSPSFFQHPSANASALSGFTTIIHSLTVFPDRLHITDSISYIVGPQWIFLAGWVGGWMHACMHKQPHLFGR